MVMSSSPLWHRFGGEVRRLRRQAGVSQEQLAKSVALSQSMLSGIEGGRKGAKREHAAAIDRALITNGQLVRLWESLNANNSYPDWFRRVVKLERDAREIREYLAILMPGLTQTADYARVVIRSGRPWDADEEVERLVDARMRRAEVLEDQNRPLVWIVLDEAAISRPIGGHKVMRGQLDHLLRLIEQRVITLQIVPQGTTAHPGLGGAFRVMSFDDRPSAAYLEHMMGGVLVEQVEEVRQCLAVFSALQAEARSPSESAGLIREKRGEMV